MWDNLERATSVRAKTWVKKKKKENIQRSNVRKKSGEEA
jgi:hypothetical protein